MDTKEVEVLGGGTKLDAPSKGAYIRNMYIQDNAWTTRPGLGQLVQIDSTLGVPDPSGNAQGYRVHLGSKAITTDFGHTQILSCVLNRSFTGEAINMGLWADVLSVTIYDVTTNEHYEEVLFRHTAENNPDVNPMPNWRGVYETARDQDLQAWQPASSKAPMYFIEVQDHLFFGSASLGVWVYTPADFSAGRRKQVNSSRNHTWSLPYSETSLLVRLSAVPGLFADQISYITTAAFPAAPQALATWGGRILYAQGREVYFSDPGLPASITAQNIISITSELPITAIVSVQASILIFTEAETFHYTPSVGDTVSLGRLTRLSPDVGCLSPTALCLVGERVFWLDVNGAYTSDGGFAITKVTDDIAPYFESHLTDPLSSYLTANGTTDLANDQPRMTYRLSPTRVSCDYDPLLGHVLVTVPDTNLMLLWHLETQAWSICPLESMASGTVAAPTPGVVGRQSNIQNPWVTESSGRVFIIAGPESFALADEVSDPINSLTGSLVVLEWGRGGGLDRSSNILEDRRSFTGGYAHAVDITPPFGEGDMYFAEPISLPNSYRFPGGIAGVPAYPDGRVKSNVYLVPVILCPTAATEHPASIGMRFTFDNTKWRVVTRSTIDPTIEVILPAERGGSAEGWGIGLLGPVAATAEAQIYDSGTGLVDPNGDQVRLYWSAATATARKAWPYAAMNAPAEQMATLVYLPFEALSPTTAQLAHFNYNFTTATVDGLNTDVWAFDKAWVGSVDRNGDDKKAQPVDWAIKSAQVGIENENRLFYRGCYIRMKTQGQAESPIFSTSPYGMGTLSVVVGSDWNSWTSQVVTYTGTQGNQEALQYALDQAPIRSRVMNTTTGTLTPRVFNNAGATWSDTSNPTTGTFLIDEVELDTIAVSDAIKGESIDIMLFGMIRSRAESLSIESIKASLRNVIGGRRRIGRLG